MTKTHKTHWYSKKRMKKMRNQAGAMTNNSHGEVLADFHQAVCHETNTEYIRKKYFSLSACAFFFLLAAFMIIVDLKLRGQFVVFSSLPVFLLVFWLSTSTFFKIRTIAIATESRFYTSKFVCILEEGHDQIDWRLQQFRAVCALIFPVWLKIIVPTLPTWMMLFMILMILVLGAFDVLLAIIQLSCVCISAAINIVKRKPPFNLIE